MIVLSVHALTSRRPERISRRRTLRVRPAARVTSRARVITTRGRRLPGRRREEANTR